MTSEYPTGAEIRSITRARKRIAMIGLAILVASSAARAQDLVAKTEPLTPEQERATFKLPAGFEIQLVAAEPDIKKPMNIAFDAAGRLWLTETIEYPYPAIDGKTPRDGVKILADFDATGRAKTITQFATGLNIPIGLLPKTTRDGKASVLVHSIPDIYRITDTDGDGKGDKREVLLGTYGSKDTHGMTNHFTVGYDGWVYACHGFSNTSTVRARDGSEITMNSGNTYRFKPDGSHIEFFTHGQVNPFGLAFDEWGNLYSADCHSRPQYQLLRGAYYPSFGKPDDGLGFGPEMCTHDHGSTAIAGDVYYAAEQFPPEYRRTLFIGNVVTNKINHDRIERTGASVKAIEQPDFLTSSDPWFRPVDLKMGPDGALYVADFYNRIIGHYEVPLDHPGRDRERGRIWRIVYRGDDGSAPFPPAPNLATADVSGLIAWTDHPNLAVCMLAREQLVDRIGKSAVGPLQETARSGHFRQKIQALWALQQLGGLTDELLRDAYSQGDPRIRAHAMRVLGEEMNWSAPARDLALAGVQDRDANVQRAAAEALGRHPSAGQVAPLLALRRAIPPQDTHLLHVTRMALRDQLAGGDSLAKFPAKDAVDNHNLAEAALGADTPQAASFLLRYLLETQVDQTVMTQAMRQIARRLPAEDADKLAALANKRFADDVDFQLALFKNVREGVMQAGGTLPAEVRQWGSTLAKQSLAKDKPGKSDWTPISGDGPNPWVIQMRGSEGTDAKAAFWSSLPAGERLTGILRSPKFEVPGRLSFFIAGHNGLPSTPDTRRNVVRLRDAENDKVLAEVYPPRNDLARRVDWDLSPWIGKRAYLEAIDGESADAYAWLAFGRFDPPAVGMPSVSPEVVASREQGAAEIAGLLRLADLAPELRELVNSPATSNPARAAAIAALVAIDPQRHADLLGTIVANSSYPIAVRQEAAKALAQVPSEPARSQLIAALAGSAQQEQLALTTSILGSAKGAELLMGAIEQGKASPRLLQEPAVLERLKGLSVPDLERRIATLTKGLVPMSQELEALLAKRRAAFKPTSASAVRGAAVFTRNCAICHRVGNEGATIGPQLDGVSKRGSDRIMEDVLDPNRNIDAAFRVHMYQLKDGQTIAGLPRRTEGEVIVLADSQGKEQSISRTDVRREASSGLSLMPGNFSQTIPADEFNDLVAFLLSK